MQTTRINNLSLFVTVLSACLLAAGSPAPAYAQPAPAADLFSTATETRESNSEASREAKRLLSQIAYVRPASDFSTDLRTSAQAFSENTRPLTKNNSILIVTHLPRAGLAG